VLHELQIGGTSLSSMGKPNRAHVTPRERAMKRLVLTALVCGMAAGSAYGQSPSCKAQAADKKLAGAALNSFMKKCQSDAQKSCDTSAAEKKLSGAAKTSFTKKCVSDAVGS
jgi:hypothetical protein